MSGRIVGEVQEYAPEDLTLAEMAVYLVLAEKARDRTRLACEPAETIAVLARVTVGTTIKALSELGRRCLIAPQHKARVGFIQQYLLTPLTPEHRGAVIRTAASRAPEPDSPVIPSTTPEIGSNRDRPVDNAAAAVLSMTPQRASMTPESGEHDSRVIPPRETTGNTPPSISSMETTQVSEPPAGPAASAVA